jgi:hypothetical protein
VPKRDICGLNLHKTCLKSKPIRTTPIFETTHRKKERGSWSRKNSERKGDGKEWNVRDNSYRR